MSADTAPAEMPGEREIRRIVDDALNSAIPEPWEVSAHAARAVLALFVPILAEKEREIAELKGRLAVRMDYLVGLATTADSHVEAAAEARALAAEAALAEAVEALAPFADEKNGAMQDILWGDQPDSATMTITCPLGQVRKAREAVRAAAIRA